MDISEELSTRYNLINAFVEALRRDDYKNSRYSGTADQIYAEAIKNMDAVFVENCLDQAEEIIDPERPVLARD